MTTSQRVFETDSIDVASYLATYGANPTIEQAPNSKRALFTFIETPDLLAAVIEYERGAALPAKRLLNVRSWLYREASNVVKRCIMINNKKETDSKALSCQSRISD